MRTALRILLVTVALASFSSLLGAAEPAAKCPGSTAEATIPAEMPDLSQIFGISEPQQKAVVSCDQCAIPQGPGFQCNKQCRAQGLCMDQCYAESTTCQLVGCVCLSC